MNPMKKIPHNPLQAFSYGIRQFVILTLLIALSFSRPATCLAQNYDYGSVEAYINDHKQQRSLLLARATIEYGNQLLHEDSSQGAEDWHQINVDLDRYTRAFDIIDIIYQSARTAVNCYNTYNDVTSIISGYRQILSDFNQRILQRGRIELADTLLISINYHALQQLGQDCEYLYLSVADLVVYCSGAAACTTAELLTLIENINICLDRLHATLRNAYLATWRFIQVRIGFWKEPVYRTTPRNMLLESAFGRWRQVTTQIITH